MLTSKATATWEGTLKQGEGVMKPGHAENIPFTMGTRFEGQTGSNPEEMIGAALAGCFSMALSLGLEKAGAKPHSIRTEATVKLEQKDGGFAITTIDLNTEVKAEGIDDGQFQQVAEDTKQNCPVSRALKAVETVNLEARLTG